MKEIRNGEFDARGNSLIRHDLKFNVTPASIPDSAKGERPSFVLQEAEVMRLDRILQKMKKAEQKIAGKRKEQKKAQETLSEILQMMVDMIKNVNREIIDRNESR